MWGPHAMERFTCAAELLRVYRPDNPVLCLRPHAADRAARWFVENFPGTTLYAVKSNPHPIIVDALHAAGIRDFDVASLPELEQLSSYRDATIYFMNPVKSRRVIAKAYFDYGVRIFALDSHDELEKIRSATGNARDLTLFVRITCEGRGSCIPLGSKFGAGAGEVTGLLLDTRCHAERLGMTFHVGSQAMEPSRYSQAMGHIGELIVRSGALPDVIDVGGGFPSVYPNLSPPPLHRYISEIESSFENMNVVETCDLLCEPGRALSAEAGSVIVRVEHRRDNALYLNDGAFGTLFDATQFGFQYPVNLFPSQPGDAGKVEKFVFYGPTCDSFDYMPGPFYLPGSVREGDYMEIGQLGAYGHALASQFNGFGIYDDALLSDEPVLTMYDGLAERGRGRTTNVSEIL